MCNGANLAYKKLFQELNGFQGNDTIASGDDVFLLQSDISRSRSLCKIKSKHCITTKPLDDWNLFYQRVAGHQRRLYQRVISDSFLAVVVLMGNLCWGYGLYYGHLATTN
jgi:hypothetical protein